MPNTKYAKNREKGVGANEAESVERMESLKNGGGKNDISGNVDRGNLRKCWKWRGFLNSVNGNFQWIVKWNLPELVEWGSQPCHKLVSPEETFASRIVIRGNFDVRKK
jgi:hypothetical protein